MNGEFKLIAENTDIAVKSAPVGTLACNCSIIYSKKSGEAILIDPGNDSSIVLDEIEKNNLKVKKIIHTHAHFDHIGDSKKIHQKTNASIYLHKGDDLLYKQLKLQGQLFGFKLDEPAEDYESLVDEQTFSFQEKQLKEFLKTIYTPGHTQGSCCFFTEYFSIPILFSGDTLFQNSIGRTDLPGGDSESIIKSINKRLLPLPDETKIITGHGQSTTIGQEKAYNPFLS